MSTVEPYEVDWVDQWRRERDRADAAESARDELVEALRAGREWMAKLWSGEHIEVESYYAVRDAMDLLLARFSDMA